MMQAAGYEGDAAALARAFLPDHAIAAERTDIVIMSMYSPGNLAANLKHQERATGLDRAAIAAIAARISS